MSKKHWRPPDAGDIVQCRFPEGLAGNPGPKDRPALVTKVDTYADGSAEVEVAYGTSQGTTDIHPGEFTVKASNLDAGLAKDTKFDLCNIVRLPFDDEWFAPSPNRQFGEHPKRGRLNLQDNSMKRKLQAAAQEAKSVGKKPGKAIKHRSKP